MPSSGGEFTNKVCNSPQDHKEALANLKASLKAIFTLTSVLELTIRGTLGDNGLHGRAARREKNSAAHLQLCLKKGKKKSSKTT